MGLSLPLVARGVVSRIDEAGPLVGRLYAVNTIGAAAGAALAGWVLQGTFGFVTTARIAGLAQPARCGARSFVVWRSAGARGRAASPSEPIDDGRAGTDAASGRGSCVYGMTGAVALGFELVFFRVIDSVMRSNSYSFPHVLATYLVFFGAGSAVGSAIVKRTRRPDRWFLATAVPRRRRRARRADRARPRHARTARSRNEWRTTSPATASTSGSATRTARRTAPSSPCSSACRCLIMGAPVFFMGAAFPSAQALVSQRLDTLGRHTGTLLFSNIVGNVVGTLLVGFVAIDRIGTSGTYLVLALLLVALGVAWAWHDRAGRRRWIALGGGRRRDGSARGGDRRAIKRFWSFVNGVPEAEPRRWPRTDRARPP